MLRKKLDFDVVRGALRDKYSKMSITVLCYHFIGTIRTRFARLKVARNNSSGDRAINTIRNLFDLERLVEEFWVGRIENDRSMILEIQGKLLHDEVARIIRDCGKSRP